MPRYYSYATKNGLQGSFMMSKHTSVFICIVALGLFVPTETVRVPIRVPPGKLQLTEIGQFGRLRKARTGIRAHYHSGIDIKRPEDNDYSNTPIYTMAKGIVISRRDDGAYAQLIVEHSLNGKKIWTVYEHIAGIKVNVTDGVDTEKPIARFMNREELDRYGWQFDHVHFEILKVRPMALKINPIHPQRFFNSYTLQCYSKEDLDKYFFDPLQFFTAHIK